jgi:hypothetical protein
MPSTFHERAGRGVPREDADVKPAWHDDTLQTLDGVMPDLPKEWQLRPAVRLQHQVPTR